MDPISHGTEAPIFLTPQENPIDQIESPRVLNKTKVIASGRGGNAIGTLQGSLYMNSLPPPPVVSDLTSVLHELYKSEEFKEIKRLIDPNRSISISDSFINLAIIREEVQKKMEDESLVGKEGLESPSPKEDFIYLNSHEAILAPKESIKIGNLFDHSDADQLTPNRLVVVGAAGIGKSTLCQYLANAWAEGSSKLGGWRTKFDFVFLIRFRDLAEYPEECLTLEGMILKSIGKEGVLEEGVLGSKGRKVLFLYDGYDEGAAWIQETPTRRKLWKELLDQPHWILTTRPNYFNEPRKFPDCRKLEIVGFTRKHTAKYIDRFFVDPEEQEKKNSLKKLVQANSRVEALSRIPICLELLCSIWKIKSFDSADSLTMTKLYEEIATYLFQRYDRSLEGRELPLISKDPNCGPLLRATEIVAWMGLVNPKASLIVGPDVFKNPITHLLLSREISDDAKKDFHSKLFRKLGFFKPTSVSENSKRPELASYYFLHLTFQEYFAARHFVERMLADEPLGDKSDWKDFLQEAKFDPKLAVVFWFVVGLLSERARFYERNPSEKEKALKLLNEFFEVLLEEPRSLLRLHELALAMRCFEESEGVSNSCRKRILGEFSSLLRELSKGKIRAYLYKDFSHMFRRVQKFYSLDTENEILNAVRAGTVSQALNIISDFRLCAPGVVSFCIEKTTDAGSRTLMSTFEALGKLSLKGKERTDAVAALLERFDESLEGIIFESSVPSFWCQLDGEDLERVVDASIQRLDLNIQRLDLNRVLIERLVRLNLRKEVQSKVANALIQRLEGPDIDIRRVAVYALGEQRWGEEVLGRVVEALVKEYSEPKFWKNAIEVLGTFKLKGSNLEKALEFLFRTLDDPDEIIRYHAAIAICKLHKFREIPEQVIESLVESFSGDIDTSLEVARAIANSRVEKKVVSRIVERFSEGVGCLPHQLLPQLRLLEGEDLNKVVRIFMPKLQSRKKEECKQAAKWLGNLSLKGEILDGVLIALAKKLTDPQPDVLANAACAIGKLSPAGEEVDRATEAILDLRNPSSLIVFAKTSGLKIRGAVLQKLAQALLDPNFSPPEEAIDALASLPLEGEALEGAVSLFFRGVDHSNKEIKMASTAAMGRLHLGGQLLERVAKKLIEITSRERDWPLGPMISSEAAIALGRLPLEGEVLKQALDALIARIDDGFTGFPAISKAIQDLVDLRKAGTLDFSARVVAYKVFLSQIPCYFRDGSFFFYSQGRISDPIPMEEARYQEIKKFVETHLLPLSSPHAQ